MDLMFKSVTAAAAATLLVVCSVAVAQDRPAVDGRDALVPEYESVYAPPQPRRPGEGVNEGGVHVDLSVSYLTDSMYRGVDRGEDIASFEDPDDPDPLPPDFDPSAGHEDSPNLQFDGQLTWDLGRGPHPFVGVFVNTYDGDPESEFQEIRPYVGVELTIRPLILAAGHTSYIHPDRDQLNTTEVWGRLGLDDSYFFNTDAPVLSPYVFGAYDYDLYDGVYVEAGVEHVIDLDEVGVTLTAQASIAYVESFPLFAMDDPEDDAGFQHYQFGLIGEYELNTLLNIPQRYGEWTLRGYLYYTDGIDDDLRADTQLWGGAGIGFHY